MGPGRETLDIPVSRSTRSQAASQQRCSLELCLLDGGNARTAHVSIRWLTGAHAIIEIRCVCDASSGRAAECSQEIQPSRLASRGGTEV